MNADVGSVGSGRGEGRGGEGKGGSSNWMHSPGACHVDKAFQDGSNGSVRMRVV